MKINAEKIIGYVMWTSAFINLAEQIHRNYHSVKTCPCGSKHDKKFGFTK